MQRGDVDALRALLHPGVPDTSIPFGVRPWRCAMLCHMGTHSRHYQLDRLGCQPPCVTRRRNPALGFRRCGS